MSSYKHRCHLENEMTLCRHIFTVSIRDMVSNSNNSYSVRCKKEARQWFDSGEESSFSFNNVVNYLFGEIDEEMLRDKLKKMLKNKKIKGNRNIIKILDDINAET